MGENGKLIGQNLTENEFKQPCEVGFLLCLNLNLNNLLNTAIISEYEWVNKG